MIDVRSLMYVASVTSVPDLNSYVGCMFYITRRGRINIKKDEERAHCMHLASMYSIFSDKILVSENRAGRSSRRHHHRARGVASAVISCSVCANFCRMQFAETSQRPRLAR